jgi:hypothetical protein
MHSAKQLLQWSYHCDSNLQRQHSCWLLPILLLLLLSLLLLLPANSLLYVLQQPVLYHDCYMEKLLLLTLLLLVLLCPCIALAATTIGAAANR